LTSLAGRVSASDDPFGKVKQLIQELLERLLQEEGNEANHKGWCTKAMTDAEQRRNYAADAIERLNSQMAALEARRGTLRENSARLGREIDESTKERATAIADRAAEKAQNEAIIQDGREGLDALVMAQDILSKFYGFHKATKVDLELDKVQASAPAPSPAVVLPDGMGPEDHAPDMPFKIGETYHGDQATYTGIEGMLQVMASDFQRTMDETARLEAEAQREHVVFLTEIESALAQKKTAKQETDTQLRSADQTYDEAKGNLHTEAGSLKTAISELLDLKPVCVDTGMTYQERVTRREDEIASLQKALCILGDYMGKGEGC
jgi:chromosome segregation ATPase